MNKINNKVSIYFLLASILLFLSLVNLHAADSQPSVAIAKSPRDIASVRAKQTNVINYYVATDGADTNPGTLEQPFATLEGARDAIRKRKKPSGKLPAGGVIVYLRGGIYPRKASFVLGPEDSGTPDAPVVYTAFPGEMPRLLGGIVVDASRFQLPNNQEVEHFKRADTAAKRRNGNLYWRKVRTLDLNTIPDLPKDVPGAISSIAGKWGAVNSHLPLLPTESELFVNGQRMVLARWPNHGDLFVEALDLSKTKDWEPPYDIWAKGSDNSIWYGLTCKVAMPIDKTKLPDKGFYFFNVMEEMDVAGEYYIDRVNQRLHIFPPDQFSSKSEVLLSTLTEPVVNLLGSSFVTLRGLTVEASRGDGISINGGDHCTVSLCEIRNLGHDGILIKGEYHSVLETSVHDIGAMGIRVDGGDLATGKHSGHLIAGCEVMRPSQLVGRTSGGGSIQIDGVGHTFSHNEFHDNQTAAIQGGGYQNVYEFNEFYDVIKEINDGAALKGFSGGATWSNTGSIFRHNYFHDIQGVPGHLLGALYADCNSTAGIVFGNVFANMRSAGGAATGIIIHGGRFNNIINNLFVNVDRPINIIWRCSDKPSVHESWMVRPYLKMVAGNPLFLKYPHSQDAAQVPKEKWDEELVLAKYNTVNNNAMIGCGELNVDENVLKFSTVSGNKNYTSFAEAGFVDTRRKDFTLRDDSRLFTDIPGFRAIPFRQMGRSVGFDPLTMEFEDFDMSGGGYIPTVEDGIPCGKCVEPNGSGRKQFRGQPGIYDVTVRYKDTHGGKATLALQIGGRQINRWRLDRDDDAWHSRVLHNVKLSTWDEVSIYCIADGSDAGSVDIIRFSASKR